MFMYAADTMDLSLTSMYDIVYHMVDVNNIRIITTRFNVEEKATT